MKFHSKLTLISSFAALVASPLAFAGKEAPAAPVEPPAPEVTPVITKDADVPVSDKTDAGDKTDVEVPDKTAGGEVAEAGDKGAETEPGEVTANGKGEGTVPIDWVKRGGGDNPDVIFYNMAGGGQPVFKGETTTALSRELGQDDKAAAIDTKGNPVAPQIKAEKKEPVALIKKGRVFLR
jgi:hypothetical protein